MSEKLKDPYEGKEFIKCGLGRIRVQILREGATLQDYMTALKMLMEAEIFTGEKLTLKKEEKNANGKSRKTKVETSDIP